MVLIVEVLVLAPELRILLIGQVDPVQGELEPFADIVEGRGVDIGRGFEAACTGAHHASTISAEPFVTVAQRDATAPGLGFVVQRGVIAVLRNAGDRRRIHMGVVRRHTEIIERRRQEGELALRHHFHTGQLNAAVSVDWHREIINDGVGRCARNCGYRDLCLRKGERIAVFDTIGIRSDEVGDVLLVYADGKQANLAEIVFNGQIKRVVLVRLQIRVAARSRDVAIIFPVRSNLTVTRASTDLLVRKGAALGRHRTDTRAVQILRGGKAHQHIRRQFKYGVERRQYTRIAALHIRRAEVGVVVTLNPAGRVGVGAIAAQADITTETLAHKLAVPVRLGVPGNRLFRGVVNVLDILKRTARTIFIRL